MIRASSVSRICTYNTEFDNVLYNEILEKLKEKVERVHKIFHLDKLEEYLIEKNIKTTAAKFLKIHKEKQNIEELPIGAKNYLEEIWLEKEIGLTKVSNLENSFALNKGIISERKGIEMIKTVYNIKKTEEIERKTKGFLTGICDILYTTKINHKIIRDNKCSSNWETFSKVTSLSDTYLWQLVGYGYLYDCEELWVDYTLFETPEELLNQELKGLSEESIKKYLKNQEVIKQLPFEKRIKSFMIDKVPEKKRFLEKRLLLSENYYNNLTYEKCMKIKI